MHVTAHDVRHATAAPVTPISPRCRSNLAPLAAGLTANRRATDGRRGTADPAEFRAPGVDISQLAVHPMNMLATAGIDGVLVTRVSVSGQDGRVTSVEMVYKMATSRPIST